MWEWRCPETGEVCSIMKVEGMDRDYVLMRERVAGRLGKELFDEYLQMFYKGAVITASGKRRLLRLMSELEKLIDSGHVQWKSKAARPAGQELWKEGLRRLFQRKLELPLDSHGYLTCVVYELADKASAAAEKDRVRLERSGRRQEISEQQPISREEARTMLKTAGFSFKGINREKLQDAVNDKEARRKALLEQARLINES